MSSESRARPWKGINMLVGDAKDDESGAGCRTVNARGDGRRDGEATVVAKAG